VGQNAEQVLFALRWEHCKMQIANCKLQNEELQSSVEDAPWRAPSPRRRGISLTEVLIAMGILTVGLLGVASIFPVASAFMQKGDVADRGSAIAQAAFNEAVTKGYLDPAKWWMMTPTNFESYSMPTIDGPVQTFSRPVLQAISECKARWSNYVYCQRMGGIYTIDPLGVASMTTYDTAVPQQEVARPFPANTSLVGLSAAFSHNQWRPWFVAPSAGNPAIWPIRRVTFRQNRFGAAISANASYFFRTRPMDRATAERTFSSGDDLAIEVPPQVDRPSRQVLQKFDLDDDDSTPEVPIARQAQGDYSWIITVVPSDLLNLVGTSCEVSAVVFYKRPVTGSAVVDQATREAAALDERITRAKIVSTGLSGGEVLLEAIDANNDGQTDDGISESPFRNLKTGQWIMLSGPAPNSTPERPQFVARWYRVLSIEDKTGNGIVNNSATQRLVTLRGPQWPWAPEPNSNLNNANHLSNDLSAAIVPGAVAVHSKTVRLEANSSWSVQ
jgi:hypothetical protein